MYDIPGVCRCVGVYNGENVYISGVYRYICTCMSLVYVDVGVSLACRCVPGV